VLSLDYKISKFAEEAFWGPVWHPVQKTFGLHNYRRCFIFYGFAYTSGLQSIFDPVHAGKAEITVFDDFFYLTAVVAVMKKFNHRQGEVALRQVMQGRFSDRLLAAGKIKDIVHQLKGVTQT